MQRHSDGKNEKNIKSQHFQDMLTNLNKYNVYLASGSPRRKELMEALGIPFRVKTIKDIDENYPSDADGENIAKIISLNKANAYLSEMESSDLIITADTIVYANHRVYGKPRDTAEAKQMLKDLSGRTHSVITGVTIVTLQKRNTFAMQSEVTFDNLSDQEIDYYIKKYQPFDKAGAYGIQEWIGMIGVKSLNGCFFNVMGLPIQRLYQELKHF